MSRTSKSIRNAKYSIIGQVLAFIITFITRMVFIKTLGIEYLGVNGLFTNILSILALAEMGIGASIAFSLYKPLSENDTYKIKALMQLFRKAYIIIGCVVGLIGISLTPFLDVFIKDMPSIPYIQLIYVMFVTNMTISYFFSYKRTLLIADQKSHITTFYHYSFFSTMNILQIFTLLLTQNYILFIGLNILSTFAENLTISLRVNKLYPYINDKNKANLDSNEKRTISRNVKAMLWHKFGTTVVMGTDNLIIAKFVSIISVGLYSNYLLITNAINNLFGLIFRAIIASVGNLGVTETNERKLFIFNSINLFGFWVYSFSAISLLILFNPFINLWLGKEYLFTLDIVLIIVINFYLTGMRKGVLTFKDAFGLFWYDRYKPLFEAGVNLIVSLYLVNKIGIIGVFIGTTVSTLTTAYWIEPYVLYKYGFGTSAKGYFLKYIYFTFIFIVVGSATWLTSMIFSDFTLVGFIGKVVVCIIVPNVLYALLFWKNENFRYLLYIFRKKLRR